MQKFILNFSFMLFFVSAFVYSQQDSSRFYKLSDVVVTATKTNTSSLEIASSITVIDSAEISAKSYNNISDLLESQYSVSITKQGGAGSLTNVFLRGGSPGQTLVLLDGIEMNIPSDPSNSFDFANLPVDNIERIEILRGPQSTLYGSDALSGVINIITKSGKGKPKFFFSTEGGSFNTYKAQAGINGSYSRFNYSSTFSRFKTNGFSAADEKLGNTEKDGSSEYNASAKLSYSFSPQIKQTISGRFVKGTTNLDQFGGSFGDDSTYIYNLEETAVKSTTELKLFNGSWNQSFGISYLRNIRNYHYDVTVNNPSSSRSNYDGRKFKLEWQNIIKVNENNKLSFGAETENEKVISEFLSFSSAFNSASQFPEKNIRTSGFYLQDQLSYKNRFFSTVGIRLDDHEKFGSAFTFRIAPAFLIWETGTKLKATYGTGFKAPSLFYLYDSFSGNENLQPEHSRGWDAGVEQYISSSTVIGVTYFYNLFKDLIGFDAAFKAINTDKAVSKGIEFYLKTELPYGIKLNINYTYNNTIDKSKNSNNEDKNLLRRPENKASININYIYNNKLNTNLEGTYVGTRDDLDFSKFPAETVRLKSYFLINLSVSYKIVSHFTVFGRIENLSDEDYQDVLGFGTAGRSAYAGIKLNF